MMKYSLRAMGSFILLLGLIATLYSFAMFQGGFVSWFLFYSFLPIFLYYLLLLLYPIKKWKITREMSKQVVLTGDQVSVTISIQRKVPLPIFYCTCEQIIPKTMNKIDIRNKKYEFLDDPSSMLFQRQAKQMIFPWFSRTFQFTFDFPHVPRGEHSFETVRVRTGDLFGLTYKEHSFQLSDYLVVYPVARPVYLKQRVSNFHEGSVSSYLLNLKHMNVATGVREYVPGDKFSWIDWKQTARQQEIMTKEFEQEKSTDIMVIFDGTYEQQINPIAFEGSIELTLSLINEMAKQGNQIGLLTLGKGVVHFPVYESLQKHEQIRQHLTRIGPVKERPTLLHLHEELMKIDSYFIFLFVTTTLDDHTKEAIEKLKFRSAKVVVLFVQAERLVTEQDRELMQLIQHQHIDVILVTEKQLQYDPIEVMV